MSGARFRKVLLVGGFVVLVASACTLSAGGHRIVTEQSAYRLPAAGQCQPTQFNRSDVLRGTHIQVSPLPGSLDASPQTQISLLGVPVNRLRDIDVSGSATGPHRGRLRSYSQGDGGSFLPRKPFNPGEVVTVSGTEVDGSTWHRFSFRFAIAHEDPIPHFTGANPTAVPEELQAFESAPSLHPPVITVIAHSSSASKGDIFLAPYNGPSQNGPMIVGESGQLIWFDPLPYGIKATNVQVQRYEGRPVLTWWQGWIPKQGFGEGEEVVDNSSYQRVLTIHAGNGYEADLHDFHLMGNHTALLTVFNPIHCDLTSVGGPAGAAVTDTGFQEIDLRTGLVRRQWFALDHVPLSETDAVATGSSLEWPLDYFHINSIDEGPHDRTLISSRNTSTLYELDTRTGQILLQIGGKKSSVRMGPGTETDFQHDASWLRDGDIAVFDNGSAPKIQPESRALIEHVDPKTRTATMVAQYEHANPTLSAESQGSVEALADGDYFVGWGGEPYFSEYSHSGALLFDASIPRPTQSYRAYRFEWHATPATPPLIVASTASTSTPVTVYASWNGATEVAKWELLGGESPGELTPLAAFPSTGFETKIESSAPEAYVQVEALNAAGTVLGISRAVAS